MSRWGEDHYAGAAPLRVFYDGRCPLCRRARARYGRAGRLGELRWLDVNTHMEELSRLGISKAAALGRIHVIGPDGRIQTGAAAIAAIWRRLPHWRYRLLAALTRLPGALPVAERVYDFIARHRSRGATP